MSLAVIARLACRFSIVGLCVVLMSCSDDVTGSARAATKQADAGFVGWVKSFWPHAEKAGIKKHVYVKAFENVAPDHSLIRHANRQPESVLTNAEYIRTRVTQDRIISGREMLKQYGPQLDIISKRHGVSKHIILAIWGMETNYGKIFVSSPQILKPVIQSLSSLAYFGKDKVGNYARYGRKQLIPALKILQKGHVTPDNFVGSWAAAMGHTQFIPTSYLDYAADHDGDGRADVWTSIPDALNSTANYLNKFGWHDGKTWGYEVKLPYGFNRSLAGLKKGKTIATWQKLGIKRVNSKAFPRLSDRAYLFLPSGTDKVAFLVLKNFSVIKRYNISNSYALAVGLLADSIMGYKPALVD